MKTKLFFLFSILFFLFKINAQIVNIPDANFKAKLLQADVNNKIAKNLNGIYSKIDINSNGEIELSEAENVYELNIGTANISSLDGISYFTNISLLHCFTNKLMSLNLMGLKKLIMLNCGDNQINSLVLDSETKLQGLYVSTNKLTSLDSIDLSKVKSLSCSQNPISSLDLSSVSELQYLDCSKTNLSSLSLINLPFFNTLVCDNNSNLTNVNLSNLPNLEKIICRYNPLLKALNLNNFSKLSQINCTNNSLENLNLNGLSNVSSLLCQNNQLKSLDIGDMEKLNDLSCYDNQISYLNANNNKLLSYLYCENNKLVSLQVKNGQIWAINFSGNPDLKYICVDENLVGAIKQKVLYNGQTAEVNSYCSFNPGGNHNTISGNVKLDSNQNGCDLSDNNFSKLKIKISKDNQDLGITSTDLNGNYYLFTDSGNFTLTPILENIDYFTIFPSSAIVNFADSNNNSFTQNFCVVPNGTHNDLEVQLAPVNQARPGFEATYRFVYLNKGNTTLSGSVNLDYQGNKITFVSSELPPDTNVNSNLVWNFTDLKPFEQKSFIVTFRLNPPTHPTDPLNSGDKLTFTAKIFPINNDETPKDNNLVLHQYVVNSLDPNDKTCLEGDIITPDLVGTDVHYLIRFENVGTANAVNVVVKDMIDTAKFDVESLQPIKSSHPYRMTITEGNKVEFFFENIQLPFDDANNDGYILFKIKTKPSLVVGDTFSNKADIYFDYNFPVETNQAVTTVQTTLGTQEFSKSELSVYPNPAKGELNFKTSEKIKKAEIFDVNGRLIKVELGISNNQINVSSLKRGSYIVKVQSYKKTYQTKFIKE